MLKLGEKQILTIVKEVDFGVYLGESPKDKETVLLPKKQVPQGSKPGDELEVFLYRDSSDRMIATTNMPKLTMGELAVLTVKQTGKIGAFLDWGLEKDLFLPFREQTGKVREGASYLTALYLDKSSRLCATMRVYDRLRCDSPYEEGMYAEGIIYDRSPRFGLFVAVDNCWSALVPGKEDYGSFQVGDHVRGRVTKVREDGKLDLSLREKAYLQLDADAETILEMLAQNNGTLPFTDKSSPEEIREKMHMSKAAYKRGIGHLLKEGRIEIGESEIRRKSAE